MKRFPFAPALASAACGFFLAGCGRYADFTLPPLAGGDPRMTFQLEEYPAPVMTWGAQWDTRDVLNPSVVRGAGSFLNFYSGFDGQTWRTGVAQSEDGLAWRKQDTVFGPDSRTWEGAYIAANGSALSYQGRYWYWYQAGPKSRPRIGLVRLPQGAAGAPVREPAPVLDYGPYGNWDERAVADPDVIRIEPYFYMYYLGQDRARRQRIGVARSRDGMHWEKLRSNPILELGGAGAFDEAGLGEPAVWTSHGFYWMLYTGRDAREHRRLGLARSTDGVRWRKLPEVFAGAQDWNSTVLCDPSVQESNGKVFVWFGGGDKASPDENLNGQIGVGELHAVYAGEGR